MIAVVLVAFAAHVVAWIALPSSPKAPARRAAPAQAGGQMRVSGI
jgi:hypothetical protein